MTDLSRRTLLGLAAAVPLTACTSGDEPPPPPDPDDLLRAAAVERERALLQRYDAAVLREPALGARLAPVRAEHEAHLAALLGTPSPSPAPSPTTGGASTVADLVAAEREAAAAHARGALEASRELAGLLASLSASETSHPVALA